MTTRNAGRVAVVDDEENIRETVGYALKREGYRVDLYPDGQAAWEKFTHALPDVLVLAVEVLHHVREPHRRHAPLQEGQVIAAAQEPVGAED